MTKTRAKTGGRETLKDTIVSKLQRHIVLDGYIDKKEITTVSKMATWTRRGLQQWLRWLHGQDGDYHSV